MGETQEVMKQMKEAGIPKQEFSPGAMRAARAIDETTQEAARQAGAHVIGKNAPEQVLTAIALVISLETRDTEMLQALEALDSPTAWFDNETHCCRFCYACNPGAILHTLGCEITKAREAIKKARA